MSEWPELSQFKNIQDAFTEGLPTALERALPKSVADEISCYSEVNISAGERPYVLVKHNQYPAAIENGIFVAYIFDPSSEKFYLTLTQGINDIRESFAKLNNRETINEVIKILHDEYSENISLDQRYIRGSPNLGTNSSNVSTLEDGTIYYISYDASELGQSVTQKTLVDDFRAVVLQYVELLEKVYRYLHPESFNRSIHLITPEHIQKCTIDNTSKQVSENQDRDSTIVKLDGLNQGDILLVGKYESLNVRLSHIGFVETKDTDGLLCVDQYDVGSELPVATNPTVSWKENDVTQISIDQLSQLMSVLCYQLHALGVYESKEKARKDIAQHLGLYIPDIGVYGLSHDRKRQGSKLTTANKPLDAGYYWVNNNRMNEKSSSQILYFDRNKFDDPPFLSINNKIIHYESGFLIGISKVTSEPYLNIDSDGREYFCTNIEYESFQSKVAFPLVFNRLYQDNNIKESFRPVNIEGVKSIPLALISESVGNYIIEQSEVCCNISKLQDLIKYNNIDFEIPNTLYYPEEQPKQIKRQIKAGLNSGKHVILTGPPGTGKSKLAGEICNQAILQNIADGSVFTTATSEWTSYDTVGGYMPTQQQDESTLQFTPGQFLKCFRDQDGNIINNWLVIDELNRSDIDKSFGQLFSVLSGDSVELPYQSSSNKSDTIYIKSISDTDDESSIQKFAFDKNCYPVTPSWRLICTMNSMDKASLYEMSYAFMRRFAFIYIDVPSLITADDNVKAWVLNPNTIDNPKGSNYAKVWLQQLVGPEKKQVENTLSNMYKELSVLWANILQYKPIGPAIIYDIIKYISECDDQSTKSQNMTDAIISFILPQMEGMRPEEQRSLIKNLSQPRLVIEKQGTKLAINEQHPSVNKEKIHVDIDVQRLCQISEQIFNIKMIND